MPDEPHVLDLGEVGAADLALAGGKAANLGELVRAGFNVPRGFVVTTPAHAHAEDGRLTASDAAQVAAAYEALGAPAVAVRSSGTAEDLPDASFAGQHDTFLHVLGTDEVTAAVERCWASLWTDRAVEYRARRGPVGDGAGIAVVVQEMAPHESSGVVFTVNPLTGDGDELLINATRGVGEALVSGEVIPDEWVARRPDGAVLRATPARRPMPGPMLRRAPLRPGLTSDQVRELTLLALRVEQHFGGTPQDIEWSFGAGAFHVLQARPVTALRATGASMNR